MIEKMSVFFFLYYGTINVLALAGLFAFFSLPLKERKLKFNLLLITGLVLVCFYEDLAFFLGRIKHLKNHWVFNIFFLHLATWINLFILRELIHNSFFKKIIFGFVIGLLVLSGIPYALGVFPYNEFSNFSAIISLSFIISSCGFFFFDLLSNDIYLPIQPIRYSGFWISTAMLFFYSTSFAVLLSLNYLIEYHLEIFSIVRKLSMISSLFLYLTFFLSMIKWKVFKQYDLKTTHEPS